MKTKRATNLLPLLVGLLLGFLQTGLFLQLTLLMSSGFMTYLLITFCWLVGSAIGVRYIARLPVSIELLLGLMMVGYIVVSLMVNALPFNTKLVPLYGCLIVMAGLYPGVFFVRLSTKYTARILFFWENNGFILGMVFMTLLFMILGQITLAIVPIGTAGYLWWLSSKTEQNSEIL